MALPSRRHSKVVAVATVVVLAASGVAAFAAIPHSATQAIDGCYRNTDGVLAPPKGSLRVVDRQAGEGCRNGETALAWNQQGEQGDPGPQGIPGPQGLPGPAGLAESHLWFAQQQPAIINLTVAGGQATIASVNVPPGHYRVDGRLTYYAFGSNTDVRCDIAGIRAASHLSRPAPHQNEFGDFITLESSLPLDMTVALAHPGGPIPLVCSGSGEINAGTLLVTRVTTVNSGTP